MNHVIADQIDMHKVIRWALELSALHSPPGQEGPVAEYLYEEYRRLGLQCKLQQIAKGRCNAIGRLEGRGGGYELMYNGHLDHAPVGHVGRYAFNSAQLPSKEDPPAPRLIGDKWLFGHHIVNMKTALAAYLGAIDAIIRSGVHLKGSVTITGVVGAEPTSTWIDSSPVTPDQELGAGTKYMLRHGLMADMCVIGEPTGLAIIPAHFGRVRVRLSMRDVYRAPISKMNKVLAELEEWMSMRQRTQSAQKPLRSAVIAGIQCCNDYRPSGGCNAYLEFRTNPGQHPLVILNEIRGVVGRLETQGEPMDVVIEPLLTEQATEVEGNAPVMRALRRAHEDVAHAPAQIVDVGAGGDAVRFNQAGIPTVLYGPGGRVYEGASATDAWNYQSVEDLATAARVYATLAADVCSRDRLS